MHRIRTIIAAAAAVSAVAVAGGGPALASPAHRQAPAPPKSFYLSLGDSLAQGVQPNAKGQDVITKNGYPDQLFGALHPGNPTLNLAKLGCPGETTATMINGGICTYKGAKSQLAAAVAFLKAHQGHIQLVTIDIGANDLNPCVVLTDPAKLVACLEKTIPKVVKNLGAIMTALRSAPGGKTVPIIGMTYYDPELAGWLIGTTAAKQLAQASISLASQFGLDLRKVYKAFGAPVASEFAAFHTSDFNHMVTLPAFGKVPRDVAYICSYTFECTAHHDEHAKVVGYGVIAESFLKVILGG
jgi:lysophospholipase L1-like esterase